MASSVSPEGFSIWSGGSATSRSASRGTRVHLAGHQRDEVAAVRRERLARDALDVLAVIAW
jgi:hypothetical protein